MKVYLPSEQAEIDQLNMCIEKNFVEISAVAYHFHLAYGRGVVQLSDTGEPESYLVEAQLTDQKHKADVMSYNPETTVLIFFPVPQGNIFATIKPDPAPGLAQMILKAHATREDGHYHGTNTMRLIRVADIEFYESILKVALEVTETLNNMLTTPYRRDVVLLAIRLIGQAQTLYHLGTPSVALIPRLGGREPVADFSSVAGIFRAMIETFLTMHEVFFEPKDENDFEFYHSRWMLIGLHNIKKHTHEVIYNIYAPNDVEPMRIEATQRIRKTIQYQEILAKKKNNHDKAMKALLHRNRDSDEWQRLAPSANINLFAYQKVYSAHSGYVHSDGHSSHQLNNWKPFAIDLNVDMLLFQATRLISKMICDFASRYDEADRIAKANEHLYPVIKHFGRRVDGEY